MLQMVAVYAALERGMIRERIFIGLTRAKGGTPSQRCQKGKKAIGRPTISADPETAIRHAQAAGRRILKMVKQVGVGTGTVRRIKAEMTAG